MSGGVVIIGAGQAGVQAALSLREGGFQDPITLIGSEPYAPYQRPPLSKTFLNEGSAPESLYFKPREALEKRNIRLLDDTAVAAIDRASRAVQLTDGRAVAFDRLILATGARNRPLPLPGGNAPNVHMLRGIDDALALRLSLDHAAKAVIIGGGFIGLEVAASLRKQSIEVTLLEAGQRLCARACLPETSVALLDHQRAIGVDVRLGAQVTEITTTDGNASGVRLGDVAYLQADLVLTCVGVLPNDELAREAQLGCDNGVVVDASLRTNDPDIFAIGDCAQFPCPVHGRAVRLESVPNAAAQGRHVAAVILGSDAPFRAMPWFWSDQGDLKLQMAGASMPVGPLSDVEVVRTEKGQVAYSFANDRLKSVECINSPADFVTARKLLTDGYAPSRADLVDADWNLRALAKSRAA